VVENAFENGKLRVIFDKSGVDNPKVDGIMLFEGSLADTDYDTIE